MMQLNNYGTQVDYNNSQLDLPLLFPMHPFSITWKHQKNL